MDLLTAREMTFGYGGPPLLDRVSFAIAEGDRVGLLGRNGEGKSTLLALCAGDITPESGEIVRRQGLRVARLEQRVPDHLRGPTLEVVASGLAASAGAGTPSAESHWVDERAVQVLLTRLGLDPAVRVDALSAGLQRRVVLARALVSEPDLLLLDEPTNHLDVESILLLEEELARSPAAVLFVTHDRAFLRRLSTGILDLDRGRIARWDCGYEQYLVRKDAALAAEARAHERLDRKLAEEEAWLRQGIRARRTRNEGRVRALQELRAQRRARREVSGRVQARIQEAERSGQLVIQARDVHFAFPDTEPVLRGLTTSVLRGERIGIVGPNGAGKTTLLRLLLGELTPQRGTVRHGTQLAVAHFDQLGADLDEDLTVQQVVGDGSDHVVVGGQSRHVIGYLRDFLFTPERARARISTLSGGERSRVRLARLFTRPANVLVLDEPTNDLDLETLELLEEWLLDYQGTLLVVSHDREFLDHVVTSCLVIESGGAVREFSGGLSDWLRAAEREAREARAAASTPARATGRPVSPTRADGSPGGPAPERAGATGAGNAVSASTRKLTNRERQELVELPARIEALEHEQAALNTQLADPTWYRERGSEVATLRARLVQLDGELARAYHRWEELESRQG